VNNGTGNRSPPLSEIPGNPKAWSAGVRQFKLLFSLVLVNYAGEALTSVVRIVNLALVRFGSPFDDVGDGQIHDGR
jgi:hypothetical protein